MHGLINRSIEAFLRQVYGETLWQEVARSEGVDPRGFLTVRSYPHPVSNGLIEAAAQRLGKPAPELVEDLGAWLARLEAIRRLLRFSGRSFPEFIHRLGELPGRARMIVPDLDMPPIAVRTISPGHLEVRIDGIEGWTWGVAGLIRAMADDYGALGLIQQDGKVVNIHISDDEFSEGRGFTLVGDGRYSDDAS